MRNYDKWQSVCVNMDTICDNLPCDTTLELFGSKYKYPFFAAPVGAMKLHYGDKYDDEAYNQILVSACADAGIAAFTGDGVNPAVMAGAIEAIVCIRAMTESYIHLTRNSFSGEEELDLDYTFGKGKQRNIQYAMSNSLGFGGHNAALLFHKAG